MSRDSRHSEGKLISLTTILILSAFLIGMATGNVIGSDLEPYVLACGLSGLISFIGLELAAFRRKMNALEEEKRHIEDRLDRHVMSQSNSGFTLPPKSDAEFDLSENPAESEVAASVA